MIESERPKKHRQGRAFQQGTHGVADGLVWTFGDTVLVRQVRTGELHIVAVLGEEIVHGAAFAEFAALVEADVFLLAGKAESGQPTVKILHRGRLGFERLA